MAGPVPTGGLFLGTDAPSYLSQTRADYSWPGGEGKPPPALAASVVQKSSLVIGYEAPAYETESRKAFTRPDTRAVKADTLGHRPAGNNLAFGTDAPTFTTSHRDGFPPREVDAGITKANKEATLAVNRAHFTLGYEAPAFETTYRAASAAGLGATLGSTGGAEEEKPAAGVASRRVGAPGKHKLSAGGEGLPPPPRASAPSSPGDAAGGAGGGGPPTRTAIAFGTDDPVYATSNVMPWHEGVVRDKPIDPTKWAGYEGSAAAEVVSKLTTSGKPLSAVAFGYDKPAYATETMARTGVAEVKLHAPYAPALRPRFVKDHPALAAGK